jgi:hypothetical protein
LAIIGDDCPSAMMDEEALHVIILLFASLCLVPGPFGEHSRRMLAAAVCIAVVDLFQSILPSKRARERSASKGGRRRHLCVQRSERQFVN